MFCFLYLKGPRAQKKKRKMSARKLKRKYIGKEFKRKGRVSNTPPDPYPTRAFQRPQKGILSAILRELRLIFLFICARMINGIAYAILSESLSPPRMWK